MMISAHQVTVPRSLAESLPDHQAILEALNRRDPEASETAMRVHIRRSVERLWQRARAEETTKRRMPYRTPASAVTLA